MAFSRMMKQLQLPAALLALAASPATAVAPPEAVPVKPDHSAYILTPKPPATPRINGPRLYGARPGRPFLYTIPATGERPMTFKASRKPAGLALDPNTGFITGKTTEREAAYDRHECARDRHPRVRDRHRRPHLPDPAFGLEQLRNCFAGAVDQAKVRAQAEAMAKSGLIQHGWTYINIDDTWQGQRGGKYNALQGNEKFPDMKALCDAVHGLGLKAGIYSTPWTTSYANHAGGSATNPKGKSVGETHRPQAGEQEDSAVAHGAILVRPPGRETVGGLGFRLPEIRLEPD